MKIGRVKPDKWHNYDEGDCAKPINRNGGNAEYYKKCFWKKYDRKKYLNKIKKYIMKTEYDGV